MHADGCRGVAGANQTRMDEIRQRIRSGWTKKKEMGDTYNDNGNFMSSSSNRTSRGDEEVDEDVPQPHRHIPRAGLSTKSLEERRTTEAEDDWWEIELSAI